MAPPEHTTRWVGQALSILADVPPSLLVTLAVGFGLLLAAYAKAARDRKAFQVTLVEEHSFWGVYGNPTGPLTCNFNATFRVHNLTAAPLRLVRLRLISPRVKGEILTRQIFPQRTSPGPIKQQLEPCQSRTYWATIVYRGAPKGNRERDIPVVIGIFDSTGREVRLKLKCRSDSRFTNGAPPLPGHTA